jgi:hypothetical protein
MNERHQCGNLEVSMNGREPRRDWKQPVSRSDPRVAVAWLRDHRAGAALLVVLLLCAGVASIAGLMRWQADSARWSFAVLCWLVGAGVARIALSRSVPDVSAHR